MEKPYDEVLLKIRGLIADKEHINNLMQHDLNHFGELQCDYNTWYKEVHDRIDEGFKLLRDVSQ